MGAARPFLLGSAVAICLACAGPEPTSWLDQLEPESPCYEVDLADGLDEESSGEIRSLFDCANHHGHIVALEPTAATFTAKTRTGREVGADLSVMANALGEADIDVLATVDVMLGAFRDDAFDSGAALDFVGELIYGQPASAARGSDARSPSDGVLAPFGELVPVLATTLLDDETGAYEIVGESLGSATTARLIHSFASSVHAPNGEVREAVDPLVGNLARLRLATRSPQGDRWPRASGDSLRDFVDYAIVDEAPVLDELAPAISRFVLDEEVARAFPASITKLHADGSLQEAGAAAHWLATVGIDGGPLAPGELSALYRFVRVLGANNQPMDCEIDLWITSIEWSFGNLSVRMLQLLAALDPEGVVEIASVLELLTGNGLSQGLIEGAISSGTCPALTLQTLDDLGAVEAVQQPEALELLAVLIEVLRVAEEADPEHLVAIADMATALHGSGGLEPTVELVRDVAAEPGMADLAGVLHVLADPARFGVDGGPQGEAYDLIDLLDAVAWLTTDEGEGTGLQQLRPVAATLLAEESTWTLVDRLALLAANDDAETSHLDERLAALIDADPDLVLFRAVSTLLADRTLAEPFMATGETELVDELFSPKPGAPLDFVGTQALDGDLASVLDAVGGLLESVRP